ncbi:MAG TPA: ABC transporter substrate-binding protein [Chloroflexota bacterium]|nr:ABC transporter substrate-binding protein [Chloroflexota bacterium]
MFGQRRSLGLAGSLVSFVLVLSACGGTAPAAPSVGSAQGSVSIAASPASASKPAVSAAASAAAKPGGNTFAWGKSGDAVKLDPAIIDDGESSEVTHAMFEGLVRFKPGTTDVEPALAEKWQASSDGLTWTFNLRKGVKFHDGTDFNADAVKFNFDRWSDDKNQFRPTKENEGVGFEYWHDFMLIDEKKPMFKSLEVVDPSTVRLSINYPYSPLLHNLAMFPFVFSSPTAIKKDPNKYSESPVGTGPFKFVEWVHDDHVTMAANKDYWGGAPKIDTLVLKVIKDNAARFLQLKAGAIQGMEFPNSDDVAAAKADANLQVVLTPPLNVAYVGMNISKKPFDNLKVRQAIAQAINKQAIADAFYKGTGKSAKELLAPGMLGYDDSLQDWAYDANKAKATLAEAGFSSGFETEFWYMPVSRPYYPNPKDIATAMGSDLNKIGIQTKIQTEDWKDYLKDRYSSKFQMWMLGWTGDNGDPDNFYCTWFCTYDAQQATHTWNNQDAIATLKKAATLTDDQQRAQLYKQVAKMVHDEVPFVPIAHNSPPNFLVKGASGFVPNPVGDYDFTNLVVSR